MRRLAKWGTALAALGTVTVAGPTVAAVAVSGPGTGQVAREADLEYHGSAVLRAGRMRVELSPRNNGPSKVPEAAVRLRWSVPLADGGQRLPGGCVRTGEQEVVCRTGALAVGEVGERIALDLRLRGRPAEVQLEIGTLWGGGVVDRNRANDRHQVLVLDTGDAYPF